MSCFGELERIKNRNFGGNNLDECNRRNLSFSSFQAERIQLFPGLIAAWSMSAPVRRKVKN
jgi:hypothetical protein